MSWVPQAFRRRVATTVAVAALAVVVILGLFGVPIWIVVAALLVLPACLSILWVIKRFDLVSLDSDAHHDSDRGDTDPR